MKRELSKDHSGSGLVTALETGMTQRLPQPFRREADALRAVRLREAVRAFTGRSPHVRVWEGNPEVPCGDLTVGGTTQGPGRRQSASVGV